VIAKSIAQFSVKLIIDIDSVIISPLHTEIKNQKSEIRDPK